MASQPFNSKTFDPAVWLAAWSDNGGVVLHTGEKLYVGRSPFMDRTGASALDELRSAIWRPGAASALADYLNRRSHGEALQ